MKREQRYAGLDSCIHSFGNGHERDLEEARSLKVNASPLAGTGNGVSIGGNSVLQNSSFGAQPTQELVKVEKQREPLCSQPRLDLYFPEMEFTGAGASCVPMYRFHLIGKCFAWRMCRTVPSHKAAAFVFFFSIKSSEAKLGAVVTLHFTLEWGLGSGIITKVPVARSSRHLRKASLCKQLPITTVLNLLAGQNPVSSYRLMPPLRFALIFFFFF